MCKNSVNAIVVMVDLQKCLPTPFLTNSQSFYLGKLWTLNYTISDPVSKNRMYGGSDGACGGNEMASCYLKWAMTEIVGNDNVESLIVWLDTFRSKQKSFYVLLYFWLLSISQNLEVIDHKFLLRGHTHMDIDTIHSIIERKRKRLNTQEIFTWNYWGTFVSESGKKYSCPENGNR